jgi:hypothetical protein
MNASIINSVNNILKSNHNIIAIIIDYLNNKYVIHKGFNYDGMYIEFTNIEGDNVFIEAWTVTSIELNTI